MSKEFKVIESNIQPNHKEAEIWATPTSNNGTRSLKYWNQKTQSWEGESGGGESGGSETIKYTCILYKNFEELGMIVGNFDFSTLQKGDKILLTLNFDHGEYTPGTYMVTFEECELLGSQYVAVYQVTFEDFAYISIVDSTDISSGR